MEQNHGQKLYTFYKTYRRMPSYSEMAKLFGFKSKNAVNRWVVKLIDLGVVAKDRLGKLIPTKYFDETPLLGRVTAGIPATVEEQGTDTLNLEDFLIEKKSDSYVLEVDGDSMIDAHIANGDMVIAERTNKAKDGDIVIAEVDGEWTMKYFKQKGEKIWLEPANKNFKPIYPEHSFRIAAKVKAVVRKY